MKTIIWLVAVSTLAMGQISYSPVYMSLGYGAGALNRGAAAALINPALPLMSPYGEISLLNVQANAGNNSFSVTKYNKYFTTGALLDQQDIDDILGSIPSDGLKGITDVKINILGLTSNGISYNLYVDGGGQVNIPKEFAELMFKGNELNRVYSFENAEGEAWVGLVNALSYGMKIEEIGNILDIPFLGEIDYWAFGATAKHILGIGYGKLQTLDGAFETRNTFIKGHFETHGYVSEGGNGFGLDLGTAVSVEEGKWILSASLLNVFGGIRWNKGNREVVVQATLDSVNVSNISEDAIQTVDADSSFRSFYTYLPPKLVLGMSYKLNEIFSFGFEYEQALRAKLGENLVPRIGVSTEIRYTPYVPVRFGMSAGGKYGFVLGAGIGLDLGVFNLDLGIANHRGFFGNSSKGISLGAGMRFRL